MPRFGKASLERRELLCKDLRRLVDAVIKVYDFSIIETHRDRTEQERCYNTGVSKAHFGESAHNYMPSFAMDVYPYPAPMMQVEGVLKIDDKSKRWDEMGKIFKDMAANLGIEIEWGGDWKSIIDKPHIEIKNWKEKVKEI